MLRASRGRGLRGTGPVPDGAHTGIRYAVMAWDNGDTTVDCHIGPSLGETREALRQVEAADPSYDHVELVKQTVTHTSWEPATPAEARVLEEELG